MTHLISHKVMNQIFLKPKVVIIIPKNLIISPKNIYDVVKFKSISNKAEIPYCEEMEQKVTVIGKACLNNLIRLLSSPL